MTQSKINYGIKGNEEYMFGTLNKRDMPYGKFNNYRTMAYLL